MVRASPTVPLVGCDTMRRVSVLPSGSVAVSGICTGTPGDVDAVTLLATGGLFVLPPSLDGPLWHV